MNDMTVLQAQKIISDFHGGATGWQILPPSILVDEHGNVEFEVFEEKTLFRKLLGFVILDREGNQVAVVTPIQMGNDTIYQASRHYGDTVSDKKQFDTAWDDPYLAAKTYAREFAAERMEGQS